MISLHKICLGGTDIADMYNICCLQCTLISLYTCCTGRTLLIDVRKIRRVVALYRQGGTNYECRFQIWNSLLTYLHKYMTGFSVGSLVALCLQPWVRKPRKNEHKWHDLLRRQRGMLDSCQSLPTSPLLLTILLLPSPTTLPSLLLDLPTLTSRNSPQNN